MSRMVVRTQDWEQVARQAEFKPAKMATLCSMSERHLQRIFKKHLQRTPSQWLRELQCRLAKQLISQGYSSKAAAAELISAESLKRYLELRLRPLRQPMELP